VKHSPGKFLSVDIFRTAQAYLKSKAFFVSWTGLSIAGRLLIINQGGEVMA
jgi:hypothetical protein